ncbi:MAG TPA: DUF6256 family protein [Actinomycetota bacterium]|nr:DUF6256 family protein [Actinomycetota bacterium]
MTVVLVVLAHTLSGQALIRQDVTPLALTYVGFLLMLAFRVRRGRRPALPDAGDAPPNGAAGLVPLARFVLVTATAGYAVFLAIDVVFYFVLGGQHASFLVQAVTGGAFLAYVVAVPVFLAASWIEGRLRVRRTGEGHRSHRSG